MLPDIPSGYLRPQEANALASIFLEFLSVMREEFDLRYEDVPIAIAVYLNHRRVLDQGIGTGVTESDLCCITGLSPSAVRASLRRLERQKDVMQFVDGTWIVHVGFSAEQVDPGHRRALAALLGWIRQTPDLVLREF